MKFHILFAFSLLQICLTQQHYGGNQYLIYYNNLPMGIVPIQIVPMSYTAGVQPQAVNTPNGNAAQATATNQQKYGIFNKAFAVAIPKIRYNYQPVRSDFRRRIIFHSN
uniref:Polycomb protein Asx n=1 Tax=Zeugodacus cucurbitae TaxID=28588 RepID=A0A0A1WMX4_ZEUCU